MELENVKKALALALVLAAWGCGDGKSDVEKTAAALTGGDPAKGHDALRRYGCQACHTIPGLEGARGKVGPSLEGIGGRTYLAGQLPNNAQNMIRWIRDPQGVEPGTAMPELGVTEGDGKDIAAYLYTLR